MARLTAETLGEPGCLLGRDAGRVADPDTAPGAEVAAVPRADRLAVPVTALFALSTLRANLLNTTGRAVVAEDDP